MVGRKKPLEEDAPFPLTETDRWVLSQTDEEFRLHTWDELKEIIGIAFLSPSTYSRQSHQGFAHAGVGLLKYGLTLKYELSHYIQITLFGNGYSSIFDDLPTRLLLPPANSASYQQT